MYALLSKKLLLKAGTPLAVVSPPAAHAAMLKGAVPVPKARFALVYTSTRAEVRACLARVAQDRGPEPRVWIAHTKAKKPGTDLSRDILAGLAREHGVEPVRIVSIDETWSAMWFKRVRGSRHMVAHSVNTRSHPPTELEGSGPARDGVPELTLGEKLLPHEQ